MRGRRTGGLLLGIGLLACGRCGAAPYDRVPRGDWSYDLLARWAARGLVLHADGATRAAAREFQGDEPLTREALAAYVARLAAHPEALPAEDWRLLLHLVQEYSPELRRAGQDVAVLRQGATGGAGAPSAERAVAARVTGFGLARVGASSEEGGTVRGVYRAAGLVSVSPSTMAAVSLTNSRQLDSTDPGAFPELEHAVVRLHTRFADWELGKTSRRWGPGWGGTMLLSDDAPALLQIQGRKHLSLGFLGHDYTFEQFVATLDDTGGRRYVIARRLSRPFGRRAGTSISEAVKTSTTRDLPLALVLPLYAYAAIAFDDVRNSNSVNYLAGMDLWYAPSEAVRVYGDLVIDDLTAPFGLGSFSVPRKIGMLFGLHLPHLDRDRTDIRLEWALTDGERPGSSVHEGGTYIHRNPTLSWFHDGLPLGHRMGQNRRGPFARVRHRIGPRFTLIGEWEDEGQWRATPPVGDRRRAMLYGAYDPRPDRSVAVRLERTGGALGRDTLWELQGAYRF
jgi:hypothetical protein